MLSLTIAGGIFLLDYKIKEHIDSNSAFQEAKEEVLEADCSFGTVTIKIRFLVR